MFKVCFGMPLMATVMFCWSCCSILRQFSNTWPLKKCHKKNQATIVDTYSCLQFHSQTKSFRCFMFSLILWKVTLCYWNEASTICLSKHSHKYISKSTTRNVCHPVRGMREIHSLETAARTSTFMACRGVSYNTCQILLVLAVNITGTMEPSLVGPEICFL